VALEEKNMKKILLTLMVFGLLFATMNITGVNNANATCTSYGHVVYSYTYYGATPPYGYFWVSNNTALPTYYFYFYTNNATALGQLKTAEATNEKVYVYGDAASCPTTGTSRYGGVVQYLYGYGLY
jgi:hypothetical protein